MYHIRDILQSEYAAFADQEEANRYAWKLSRQRRGLTILVQTEEKSIVNRAKFYTAEDATSRTLKTGV